MPYLCTIINDKTKKMHITIILFATPSSKTITINGISTTIYQVAKIYRGKEKYTVCMSTGMDTHRWGVSGGSKKTGFEPFCLKWAKRFAEFSPLIGWGFAWNGYRNMESIEKVICSYCDRLQVITCYPRDPELEVLMDLHSRHGKCSRYTREYVEMKMSARSGWIKTINVK